MFNSNTSKHKYIHIIYKYNKGFNFLLNYLKNKIYILNNQYL